MKGLRTPFVFCCLLLWVRKTFTNDVETRFVDEKEKYNFTATEKRNSINVLHIDDEEDIENNHFQVQNARNVLSRLRITKENNFCLKFLFSRNGKKRHVSTDRVPKSGISMRQKRKATPPRRVTCSFSNLSCRKRCFQSRDFGGGKSDQQCACDPFCHFFKDCCHDYIQSCYTGNTTSAASRARIPKEHWSCRNDIWMITSCPDSWKYQDVRNLCVINAEMTSENYANVLPVTTPDNKTFANQFCARCHGYQKHLMTYYQLDFKCQITPATETTLAEKMTFFFQFCKVSGKPRSGIPRRYCYQPLEKCRNDSYVSMVDRCKKEYYGLVYNPRRGKVYKNLFCAMCNKDGAVKCGPGAKLMLLKDPLLQGLAKPLSIVMSITDQTPQIQTFSCSKGMVYDVHSELCRRSKTFSLLPESSHSGTRKDRVALWVKSEKKMTIRSVVFKKSSLIKQLSRILCVNSSAITPVKISYLGHYHLLVEFDINLSYLNVSTQNIILKEFLNLPNSPKKDFHVDSFKGTIVKITIKPLTCVAADTYSPVQYQLIPGTSSVYINTTGEVLAQKDYFSNNTVMVQGHSQPIGNIVVCRKMLPGNCSGTYIFLERHEYVMFPNRSLLYNAASRLYGYGEYTVMNGSIMICTDFKKTHLKRHQNERSVDDVALTILTYIGFSISIVCLVFVLVTYSLFSKLRTIPGINLMNLSSALLMAHLLWLIGSGLTADGRGCTVIAIALHYSFLVSFVWMSIIAFDTWRAFSTTTRTLWPTTRHAKHKHILIRTTIGWIPLLICVLIGAALDQSDVVNIGYGGKKGCWISNSWANLYIFAIPVAVSLSWNGTLFILVVKEYIMLRGKSRLQFRQHQARRDSAIFSRIAALMGFTWVFGFVAPFTTIYLMYPFVILNTLQGLYIAAAFCFTSRVRSLYRSLYANYSNSQAASGGTHDTPVHFKMR